MVNSKVNLKVNANFKFKVKSEGQTSSLTFKPTTCFHTFLEIHTYNMHFHTFKVDFQGQIVYFPGTSHL